MLATSLNKVKLSCCIYNASGPRTYSVEALKKIAESRSGAVLAKSATKDRCDGNALPRCVNKVDLGSGYCQGSINSEGLPNFGMDYYTNGEALDVAESHNKPYIVSLSGFTLEDNMQMLEKVLQGSRVAAVELNVACPNIPDKPILAYDFEQLDAVLKAVTSHPQFGRLPLGVKLPPYFDIAHIEQASTVLAKYPISFVVCCNSIPNGLFIDAENECEAMAANHGLGGLGGGFVKHTALANVRLFFKAFNDKGRADIDIVGAGGVQSGQDAFELILCGAKAVQVGTCHWTEGAGCFDRIARELEGLMKKKGYGGIEDFRGNLKAYVKPKETKRVPETIHADADGSAVSKAAKALDRSGSSGVVYLLLTVIAALLIAMSYTHMRDFVTVQYRDKVTVV